MNQYRQLQRTKRRGYHCCFSSYNPVTKVSHGVLCGCGSRTPLDKKDNNRIVRRELAKDLRKQMED